MARKAMSLSASDGEWCKSTFSAMMVGDLVRRDMSERAGTFRILSTNLTPARIEVTVISWTVTLPAEDRYKREESLPLDHTCYIWCPYEDVSVERKEQARLKLLELL